MGEKINDEPRRNTFTDNKYSDIDNNTDNDDSKPKLVIHDSLFVDNVGIGGNLKIDDNPNITVALKDDTVVHGLRLDEYPSDYYNQTMVKTVIWNLFFCNLLVQVDHGILPAAAVTIEKKLDLNTVEYGALGSIVYLGLTIGSVIAPMVFQWNKNKLVLTVIMSINGGLLLIFTLAKNYYYILFITRMLIGFCQVFVCIYMPVWIDTFGNEKQKSAWMTVYLLASPLGIVFGYAMTAIFVSLGNNHPVFSWEWSFWTQVALLTVNISVFAGTPSKYFDIEKANMIRKY